MSISNEAPQELQRSDDPSLANSRRLTARELFWLFTHMSMIGFGGVLPWVYRILVENRKILSPPEFRELFAFAQILPGPTICNLAVIIGYRHAGIRGAAASLIGMIVAPSLVVILLGVAYRHYGANPMVSNALSGMAAVAAGLVVSTAIKMARTLAPTWLNVLFAGLMFAGVALMHWPLLAVILVLAPLAILAVRMKGKS